MGTIVHEAGQDSCISLAIIPGHNQCADFLISGLMPELLFHVGGRAVWAKFYKASGKREKAGTGQKKRVKRRSKPKELNPQAQFWKNMALTKKKKLHIRIPQRQFMGESEELNSRIREKVEQEITNILNE